MTEDGEEMVINVAEHEATQPSFDTPVKNYRILEGMGVTFHCKMAGIPLPKVMRSMTNKKHKDVFIRYYITVQIHCSVRLTL